MKFFTLQSFVVTTLCVLATSSVQASDTSMHDHTHQHDMATMTSAQDPQGVAGRATKVSRTVEVVMSDSMRFSPDNFNVKTGETIRFVVKNAGQIKHEFNIGSPASLAKHAELMLKHGDMQHNEPNVASVLPGKSGEVIWQFTRAGTVTFACLQPGHLSAGMKGSIQVSATP